MSADLNKLYSEIIKTHQASPFHFEKRIDAEVTLKAYNPICGDKFDLYLNANDSQSSIISELYFHGFGCAISKSSTSVMVKALIGKSPKQALEVCKQFLDLINNTELTGNDLILPEEFLAFSGVHDFPERIECATLAWKEMEKFLMEKLKEQE